MITELAYLRTQGWMVAAHNDYMLNGEQFTFWLLTHPSGRYVKGEGYTDTEALKQCLAAAQRLMPPRRCEALSNDGEPCELDVHPASEPHEAMGGRMWK